MTDWINIIKTNILPAVSGDHFWENKIKKIIDDVSPSGIHLAIFVEPYLKFILEGKKSIESRFSTYRCAPYGSVHEGDVLILKKSGGPVQGLCVISDAWDYILDPDSWATIRNNYTKLLCIRDPSFWRDRENASFATLMRLQHVISMAPTDWKKRDRRGWVVLRHSKLNNCRPYRQMRFSP